MDLVRILEDGGVELARSGGLLGSLLLGALFGGATDVELGYEAGTLPPLPYPFDIESLGSGRYALTVAEGEPFTFETGNGIDRIFLSTPLGLHLFLDLRALEEVPVREGSRVLFRLPSPAPPLSDALEVLAVANLTTVVGYRPLLDFSVDSDGDTVAAPLDCDDSDPGTSPLATEDLQAGTDLDCDGLGLPDEDGDGFELQLLFAGDDCDDRDPAVNPDATEVPSDGRDNDCDGVEAFDDDHDGFEAFLGGDDPGPDCDDDDPKAHPGAPERWARGVDSNCNGVVPGEIILIAGDSIADGKGDSLYETDRARAGMQPRLAELLGVLPGRVRKESDGGRARDGVGDMLDYLEVHKPDLVVPIWGANDSLVKYSPGEYLADMAAVVDEVRAAGADVILVAVTPVCCGRLGPPVDERNALIDEYNDALRAYASRSGIPFIDFNALFAASDLTVSELTPDGLHPTDPGYDIMAEALREEIQEGSLY